MVERKMKGAVPQLDAEVLRRKKYFTLVLIDGEEIMCKLLELGQYNLHVETEEGTLLVPKHSVKYYDVGEFDYDEQQDRDGEREEQELPSTLRLEEIDIPSGFQNSPPRRQKVESRIRYYEKNGQFDKPVTIKRQNERWLLTDGYTRYVAAQEMGVEEIPVKVV